MSSAVHLSKDGKSIHFTAPEGPRPATVKEFRHSSEMKSFYEFIFEHSLQKEAYEIVARISKERKAQNKK